MWRDIVAVLVLAALFVAALLSMPEPPTERERFLRSRWERCEMARGAEDAALRSHDSRSWYVYSSTKDPTDEELRAARAAVEVGR